MTCRWQEQWRPVGEGKFGKWDMMSRGQTKEGMLLVHGRPDPPKRVGSGYGTNGKRLLRYPVLGAEVRSGAGI